MKKRHYLIIAIFILISIFILSVFAEESIYSFITNVKSNPSQYTLVIGSDSDDTEIRLAVELTGFLKMSSSALDQQVSKAENLIVLGTKSSNQLISSYFGETAEIDSETIRVISNNLFITGKDSKDLVKAVELIKSYETNRNLLQKEIYSPQKFFRMTNPIIWVFIILVVIALPISIILTDKKRKTDFKEQPEEQSYNSYNVKEDSKDYELLNYIKNNLSKGHSKEELRNVLIDAGWEKSSVDRALSKF